MIDIGELKQSIENLGYIATEQLIYDTFNALCMYADGEINPGQDIFAICLEGPPGAGKTEFAKTYTKLASKIFDNNVEMVDYQCDATTGKAELFEDINISAAIRGDADHVDIPGKLVEAIKKVNTGKKVVLFIDEYDKAREETDAFFLQLLQSGKINSTQHGDLEIIDKYKPNLQVILCKNQMREELSGPLSRRIRIIRLDYMTPEVFYQVAKKVLIDEKNDKVNDGLLNLVVLMYQHAYASREVYNRLPSCSEMLIAIEDADRLLKKANAPQHIIYNTIIRNMFKSADDIKTFETGLDRVKNKNDNKLSALVKSMKITQQEENPIDINSLIAQKVFTNEGEKFNQKVQELETLISEYRTKFENMEKQRRETIDNEIQKILLEKGNLVSTTHIPNMIKIFEDESAYIKRGENILNLSEGDWTDVGSITIPRLSHHLFVDKLIEYASSLDIKIYENGILLQNVGKHHLIIINDLDENNHFRYRIMASQPVISSTFLSDIENFIKFFSEVYDSQVKTAKQLVNELTGVSKGTFLVNALVYNDVEIPFEKVKDNVYNVILSGNIENLSQLTTISSNAVCNDFNNVLQVSKEIMGSKRKVLKNE